MRRITIYTSATLLSIASIFPNRRGSSMRIEQMEVTVMCNCDLGVLGRMTKWASFSRRAAMRRWRIGGDMRQGSSDQQAPRFRAVSRRVIRRIVEGSYSCFVDRYNEWSCASENDTFFAFRKAGGGLVNEVIRTLD